MTPEARILDILKLAEKASGPSWATEWLNYRDALSPSTVKAMCRVMEAARALVVEGTNQHRCDVRCDEWTGDQNWTPCVGERFRDALAALDAEGDSL